ncbi:MAG: hypothetical protein KDF25_11550 [Burkholderiaceae bacterium]|jgi:hypothetical protein|nr:hypothetical protein [Burkholderiaceae bacterium]
MKALLVSGCLALVPGIVLAQTAQVKSEPTKPVAKKVSAKTSAQAKTKATPAKSAADGSATSSRARLKSAASQVASGVRAAEAALGPDELAIAERVYVGDIPCELGARVNVVADPKAPGYFELDGKGFRYRMAPVATTTGAIRLEDRDGGAVWLQIANKSMLMDQKRGQRLADDCQSPAQVIAAEGLKKAPARSLLDEPGK